VLEPVPRSIGFSTRKSLFFSFPQMSLGLMFLVIGAIMALVFGVSTDLKSPFYFSDSDPAVVGTLLAKERTRSSVNKKKIYDYHFRYAVGAQSYQGHSFGINNDANPGDAVDVQYAPADPVRSRLRGQLLAPFAWSTLAIVLIFPGVGLVALYGSMGQYRKYLYLLRNGVFTTGTVTGKTATNTKINGKPQYKVAVQFQTPDGRTRVASIISIDTSRLGDEQREPLVYDANDPARVVLLDALPVKIRVLLGAA
jgi:hypothetical protein